MIIKKNILIYPAGSENSINIYNSLKYNIHFELFGASMVDNHAGYIFDEEHYFEGDLSIKNEKFFDIFNNMLDSFKIDFIIPTHDEVVTFLMENENRIKAKICCSPLETTKIANDKKLTYETFKNYLFAPQIYRNEKDEKIEYPVFLKPIHGVGGKGTHKVENKEELIRLTSKNKDLLICEYLPGEEYTIDCFTDRFGSLKFCGARTRERITSGITYHSKKVDDDKKFKEIAEEINKKLKFRGAWFFQVKEDKNKELKLMEFSVRQSGTMIFFREYGFNFASLTLFDFMDQDITPIINDVNIVLDRCIHNSFKMDYKYENIYFDFDDTIVLNKKINSTAMKFIYQSLNTNKKLYLITKHEKDIYKSLKEACIDSNIFTDIIRLKPDEKKFEAIKKDKSIFIDNYFKERYEVYQNLNIPVFDVDAIECLIDDSKI